MSPARTAPKAKRGPWLAEATNGDEAAADAFVFESQTNIDWELTGHEIKVLQQQITTINASRDDKHHGFQVQEPRHSLSVK